MKRLKLAGIGCGGRTRTYLGLAAERPTLFEVVAAADPNTERLHLIRDLSRNPDFQCFPDDKALLAQPKLADVLVIGTQDAYHVEPCIAAMKKGYDILLEKPISPIPSDVLAMDFDGGVNATFTMTAFDTGRNLEIMGTLGSLRGGDFLSGLGCELLLREHATGKVQRFNISVPEGGHGGGDVGPPSRNEWDSGLRNAVLPRKIGCKPPNHLRRRTLPRNRPNR